MEERNIFRFYICMDEPVSGALLRHACCFRAISSKPDGVVSTSGELLRRKVDVILTPSNYEVVQQMAHFFFRTKVPNFTPFFRDRPRNQVHVTDVTWSKRHLIACFYLPENWCLRRPKFLSKNEIWSICWKTNTPLGNGRAERERLIEHVCKG